MQKDELLELQQTLYASRNPTRRWLHCMRRDWIFDAVRRYMSGPEGRALEIGPGSGVYLPVLAELFHEVYAADIEQTFLEHAKTMMASHGNLRVQVDDILASRLPSGYFDMVLCTEVIEHIAESQPAIGEIKRLLKPSGILVLSTPQRYSTMELAAKVAFMPGVVTLVRWLYGEPVLEMGHINLMTAREVSGQLERAGFHIIECHKSGLYLPLIAELMGAAGLRLEQWVEQRLKGGPLDGLLWTQYYVAMA